MTKGEVLHFAAGMAELTRAHREPRSCGHH